MTNPNKSNEAGGAMEQAKNNSLWMSNAELEKVNKDHDKWFIEFYTEGHKLREHYFYLPSLWAWQRQHLNKTQASIATPQPQTVQHKEFITEQHIADLQRVNECFEDDEGYDVPKIRMLSLAKTGLVGHTSRGIYMITDFGYSVLSSIIEPLSADEHKDDAKDAARYRWLREGNNQKQSEQEHIVRNCYGFEWDEIIDAAIAKGNSHE